jgi:hypothetical protein
MSVSREPTTAPAGVSFEVDRFAWVDGRLEVTGRWYGIRGRRFLRPTLDVELDGGPRRMLAVLEHKPWAADDGEEWIAAFEWNGDPVELAVAELAVAPELSVVLPPPTGAPAKKRRSPKAAGERLAAAPPRARALETALAEAEAETALLRDRLAAEQKAWQKRVEEVEALRDEGTAATLAAETARDEASDARDAAISEREELVSARDEAAAERDAAVAAREAARAEAQKAIADRDAAIGERDKALREKTVLERELSATARARDKARAERNEWLTRARDATAGQGPAQREGAGGAVRAVSRRLGAAGPAADPPPDEPEAPDPPRDERGTPQPAPPEEAATAPLPRHKGLAPAPPPSNKPRKEQIPPGGILLPPTGPGSHSRRSLLPSWAPRVLAPILLVVLVVVIALLIGWAL